MEVHSPTKRVRAAAAKAAAARRPRSGQLRPGACSLPRSATAASPTAVPTPAPSPTVSPVNVSGKPPAPAKKSARTRCQSRELLPSDVVQRIVERMARGLSLPLACARETRAGSPRTPADWDAALKHHPDFLAALQRAKAEFVEAALDRLAEDDNPSHLRWLLERRYADLFGKATTPPVQINQAIVGLPDDLLKRARDYARALITPPEIAIEKTNTH